MAHATNLTVLCSRKTWNFQTGGAQKKKKKSQCPSFSPTSKVEQQGKEYPLNSHSQFKRPQIQRLW